MFVHIIFSLVWVVELPPFGKELPTRLTICSLCILTICNLDVSCFGFKGVIWVLIAPVPGHFILLLENTQLMFVIHVIDNVPKEDPIMFSKEISNP